MIKRAEYDSSDFLADAEDLEPTRDLGGVLRRLGSNQVI